MKPLRVRGHALRQANYTRYRDWLVGCECGAYMRAKTKRMALRLHRDHKNDVLTKMWEALPDARCGR